MNQNNELWKDIKDYEGIYQISNRGDLKNIVKNTILNPSITKKGFYQCGLSKNGKIKPYSLQYLVAVHFIDNPNNFKSIIHLDGNKLNNTIDNLKWTDRKEHTKKYMDKHIKNFKIPTPKFAKIFELWLPVNIKGYDNYIVSNLGNIINKKSGKS